MPNPFSTTGSRPWMRKTKAKKLSNTTVEKPGEIIVDDEGNIYGTDGTSQTKDLSPVITQATADATYAPAAGIAKAALASGVQASLGAADAATPSLNRRVSAVPVGTASLTWAGSPASLIKGLNIPISGWNASWDSAGLRTQVDRAVQLGMNTIRLIGDNAAYAANPTTYKTNLHALFEYARTAGVKVVFAFVSGSWQASPSNLSAGDIGAYTAMVSDLMAGYVGDSLVLAWDIGNELDPRTSWVLQIIQAIGAQIGAVDPTATITSSVVHYMDSNTTAVRTAMGLVDQYVHFHDVHVYQQTNRDALPATLPKVLASATNKPILFGEIGANRSPSGSGNAPQVGGQRGQEFHISAFRKYSAFRNVIGVMWWKSNDTTGNATRMGLWDENGAPTRQLGVVTGFPATRFDAARDLVETRMHPVLVFGFYRAASTSAWGAPDMGGSAVGGSTGGGSVFGIDANGGYVVTQASSGVNYVAWDMLSIRNRLDAEFIVTNPASLDIGLVWRLSLVTNNPMRRFRIYYDAGAGGYRAAIIVWDGTAESVYATSDVIPDLHTATTPTAICLTVDTTADVPVFSVNGQWHWAPIPITDTTTLMANNGRGGPCWGAGDNGSRLRHIQGSVPGRVFA